MQSTPKLTKKQESDFCLACGECCKRYCITVLPEEANKISKSLGKTRKDFLENDCVLNVKLFLKTTPGVLTYPSTFFPKRIFDLLKKEIGSVGESYFIVPQVVLKREEKKTFKFKDKKSIIETRNACKFIRPENNCDIYEARPAPCRLFPFIAMPGLREQYPFCELFQKTYKDLSIESKIYYSKVQDYFKEIDNKSFTSFWRTPPTSGAIFLQDKEIGTISLEELELMMPKKQK
ncbi:MAG: YkgJ family cysteine cluster protein [archaeon]|jgi:Fe-S-cluster containining protein